MLEYLEKNWERCLYEAKERLLNERLAVRKENEPFPDLPTDLEAFTIARQIFADAREAAMRIMASRDEVL